MARSAKGRKRKSKTTSVKTKNRRTGFKTLAMHVTEETGRRAFNALRAERPRFAAFALESSQPSRLDPESAAKRILQHALASPVLPSLTAPKVGDTESEFKSLGVETVPLTGTNVVKFRQQVQGVPIYGSLVSVELDDDNECVSLNSNLATPDIKSPIAKISQQDALRKAAKEAGYGQALPSITPVLNYYLDDQGTWHLAYIVENVRVNKREKRSRAADGGHQAPLVFDYVVDALNGKLVAALPRTPTAVAPDTGVDELGVNQTFGVDTNGRSRMLRDTALNIETYDFGWADPEVHGARLPGSLCSSPPNWQPAAISAHVNAARVAKFLRDVLQRNNIDGRGGRIVSSVNCVVAAEEDPRGSRVWLNAFWDGSIKQMVYGQALFNNNLRSLSSALDVVGHELFHGVTDHTAKLEYALESGALNESYSDVFGVLISNFDQPDIGRWNWQMGDGISSGISAFRDFQDPTRNGQPKHMRNWVRAPNNRRNDYGAVHTNSGIHNYAAYKVMTAQDAAGAFVFTPTNLAAMFYIALTQHLSRQSGFADSKRGVILATRSLFRSRPAQELQDRVSAVEAGFKAAGIR